MLCTWQRRNAFGARSGLEWNNRNSLTYKNRRSIPPDAREGFVVAADMGGVIVLDPSGQLRGFAHLSCEELSLSPQFRSAAEKRLAREFPEIACLLGLTQRSPRST